MDDVSPDQFRRILSEVPTPVVVVTAAAPSGLAALAIGSFVSISLVPLLVGVFPAKTSTSWPSIREAGHFCINVLAEDQVQLSRTFSARGGDKFASVPWRTSPLGCPIIEGCVVWIDCKLESEMEIGDHTLAVGRVRAMHHERDAHALVFHRGDYTSTSAAVLTGGEG